MSELKVTGRNLRTLVIFMMLAVAQQHAVAEIFEVPDLQEPVIVTGSAPLDGLVFELDPKQPRQPMPASDGADYLQTVPGFSAIRNGGSNGDPVLRGLFGSRLNVLTDGGTLIGACPSRMDNALSYVSPETFDRLVIIKGPQSVIWDQEHPLVRCVSSATRSALRNLPCMAAAA